jgi:glycosyltransferase involved in cell wall biosynthesis
MSGPHLALITSNLGLGGSEVQVVQLARGLRSSGWRVTVVSLQAGGKLAQELLMAGIAVVTVPVQRIATPQEWVGLWHIVESLAPDIVHTQAFRANLWGRLAALATKRPVVASVRATYSYLPRAYYPLERLLARWTKAIITPSRATAEHLISVLRIPRPLVEVIPNGVDSTLFTPRSREQPLRRHWDPNADFLVLAPGRLVPQKNHMAVLDAFHRLVCGQLPATLVIVGSGPLEHELRARAARIPARVVFTGELGRELMPEAMAAADVICLASQFEGMPNVILEAMASARPVAATAVDGVVELVTNGEDGLLIPPNNPGALERALATLAADIPLRVRLGTAARHRAETQHSPDAAVDRHIRLYERILRSNGTPVIAVPSKNIDRSQDSTQ